MAEDSRQLWILVPLMAFLICQLWDRLFLSVNEEAEVPGPSPTPPVLNTQGTALNGARPDPHREENDFRELGRAVWPLHL